MAAQVPCGRVEVLEGYGHICMINHDLDLLDFIGPWYEDIVAKPSGAQ